MAQLVSAILAVPAVAAAKTVLVGLVSQQWRTEAVLRSLDDPDPIPVRWRVTDDDRLVDHPAHPWLVAVDCVQ